MSITVEQLSFHQTLSPSLGRRVWRARLTIRMHLQPMKKEMFQIHVTLHLSENLILPYEVNIQLTPVKANVVGT